LFIRKVDNPDAHALDELLGCRRLKELTIQGKGERRLHLPDAEEEKQSRQQGWLEEPTWLLW